MKEEIVVTSFVGCQNLQVLIRPPGLRRRSQRTLSVAGHSQDSLVLCWWSRTVFFVAAEFALVGVRSIANRDSCGGRESLSQANARLLDNRMHIFPRPNGYHPASLAWAGLAKPGNARMWKVR